MSSLYILGAGASRELKFTTTKADLADGIKKSSHNVNGHLSSGFFYYTNEFLKEVKQFNNFGTDIKLNDEWLKRFIIDFYFKKNKVPVTMSKIIENKKISEKINIEELYMEIEKKLAKLELKSKQMDKFNTEYLEAFFGEGDLLQYIHEVFSTISYYCYSIYHRVFAHYLIQTGGDVISFNWDILLEEEMFESNQWNYCDGYGFSSAGVVDKNKLMRLKGYDYQKRCESSRNIILKPHGSINWYKLRKNGESDFVDNPNAVFIGIPMTRSRALRGGTQGRLKFCEIDRRSNSIQYESLIVPPGRKRKRFSFIWDKIIRKIEEADYIRAIGFSFNDFDKHIVEEISRAKVKEGVKIDVINPDDNVVQKYKETFKTNYVHKTFNRFSEYCKWITTQSGMEDFADIIKNDK